jgi:NADH-quinone oxidoreductase subunit N
MAWSSVAQAGYMLAGIVVATRLGVQATVFYLAVYLFMNLAAFAVIVIRERATPFGDDIRSVTGLGAEQPLLAAVMTLAMLGLAGIPATAGFIGKFYLIDAAVAGDYAWLGIVIVIGSMVSLAYYLRVIAAMWMQAPETTEAAAVAAGPAGRPALAGGAADADAPRAQPEVWLVAVVFGAATLVFGIVPSPLFDLAVRAGAALGNLF